MACPFTAGGRRAAPQSGCGLSVDHLEGESERAPGGARRRGPVVRPKVDDGPYKPARGFSTAVGRVDRRTKRGRPEGRPKSREETPKEGYNTERDVRCCVAQFMLHRTIREE